MARKPRLDAPGALHHVIARGIDGQRILAGNEDRTDFLRRMADVAGELKPKIYAWTLMPNHFHLLMRTGNTGLSTIMRRLMTGHAVGFNLRHGRSGHVFQNRYKSLLCQDEPYLMALVRYIHLNPLRSGLLSTLEDLDAYPWCGHSVLMGKAACPWQDVDEILARFGTDRKASCRAYREFLTDGLSKEQPLAQPLRSATRTSGEWSRVLSRQRWVEKTASDSRVLGSDEFVESVIEEAEGQERESLRLTRERPSIDLLSHSLALGHGLESGALKSGTKRREIVVARRDVISIAVKKLGYSGAEVARHLGVSTSCVNRTVVRCELSAVGLKILDLLK